MFSASHQLLVPAIYNLHVTLHVPEISVPTLPQENVVKSMLYRPDQLDDFTAREYCSPEGLGLSPEKHDMVGILTDNCLDYYTIIHSLLTITVPFALLPSHSKAFELVHLLKVSKPSKLFVQPKYLSTAIAAAKEVGLPEEGVLILGEASGRTCFDNLICSAQSYEIHDVGVLPANKDTLAYLVFSSGTTGLPKAVMVSHGNIITSNAQNMAFEEANAALVPGPVSPTKEDLPMLLTCLPLYHTFGLNVFVFQALGFPCTQAVMPQWNVEQVFNLVPKHKVTHMVLVPSMVHQLVNHTKFETTDWSSVIGGAAYLPPDLAKRYRSRIGGECFAQGYGMSEATLSVTTMPRDNAVPGLKVPLSSVGVLMPGMEARIVREDGTDAAPNEAGELWVKGGNVVLGYYNNERETKVTFTADGWLKTGDHLKIDEQGVFYFEDRVKDTLKVGGSQVSPTEIEDVLRSHPNKLIIDVTVAGVGGGRTSDEKVPRAWIVLSEAGKRLGEIATIAALNAWTHENLSKYKWLRGGIEVLEELPKTPTGKVLRRQLQDALETTLKAKL